MVFLNSRGTSTPKALLDIIILLQAAKLLTPVSYHGERNMFINLFLRQLSHGNPRYGWADYAATTQNIKRTGVLQRSLNCAACSPVRNEEQKK